MKNLLQVMLIFVLIITSCNKNPDSKIKNRIETRGVQNDTVIDEKAVSQENEKVVADYNTIIKTSITKLDYINFFKDVLKTDGLIINEDIKIFKMEPQYWNDDLISLTEQSEDGLLSELIDENDIKFIYKQTESQKNVVVQPKNIPRKKIEREYINDLREKVDLDTYWNEIYKTGRGYYSLELPLFSIDKTVAIFRYSYSCGSLCANSGTYIYTKENGKWEWVGNIGYEIVS